VGEYILTQNELDHRIKPLIDPLSLEEARHLATENWIKETRIKLEIVEQSPADKIANEIQAEKDLMHLNLFDIENQFIQQNIDSVVADSEIQKYYKDHRNNYKKESYIVRALYIKMPDSVVQKVNMNDLFLLKNEKDKKKVKEFAKLYATSYYFEEKRWIYFDDLVREIPILTEEKEEIIKSRGDAVFKKNKETHFINVLDFRTKNISSPMEIERSKIRQHILKKRINKLRNTAKETILKHVKEKYPVHYF